VAEVPGQGWSSPIVVGNTVVVTSAVSAFSASPFASGNHIYFPGEDGTTVVIEAGDVYKEVGQNDLGEMMLASPAVAGNALFLRTETKLYRISGPIERYSQ
jgi:galactose mutarotase-like enzyme